jgi:hypothetical protein
MPKMHWPICHYNDLTYSRKSQQEQRSMAFMNDHKP